MLSKLQAKMHIKLDLINIIVYCWIVKTVTKTMKPRLIMTMIWRDGAGKISKYLELEGYKMGLRHYPTLSTTFKPYHILNSGFLKYTNCGNFQLQWHIQQQLLWGSRKSTLDWVLSERLSQGRG